jgi:hypothetical protein
VNLKIDRLVQRLDKRVVQPLISPLYIDYNPDYRAAIFLAGTEKSGTTWISDIINYRREYRYIFEPFWADRVDLCQSFGPRQYIRPDDDNPAWLGPAKAILSGRIRNSWTDKYHRRFVARQRLIKDIRANLFIKWIHCHFPAVPIILLLRHPCAVVRSHLRRTHLHPKLEPFLVQKELMEDHLAPFREAMEAAQTDFEKYVFRWCIETYVPLKQFKHGEIHLAFYEDFCVSPKTEIDRLFAFLDKPYGQDVYKHLRTPSPVARTESAIVSGGDLIDGWRRQISPEQTAHAVEILGLFGLDKIYSQDSMPNASAAYEWMKKADVS